MSDINYGEMRGGVNIVTTPAPIDFGGRFRNARKWTDEVRKDVFRMRDEGYSVTEIAEAYKVGNKSIEHILYDKIIPLASRRCRKLTEKQIGWLKKHYKHTKNVEICEKLGIGQTTLHRLARQHGLKKSRQFMNESQLAAAKAAYDSHVRNNTFPPKGYIIPNSPRFAKGHKLWQTVGKKRAAEILARRVATYKQRRDADKRRWIFGLEQKTKFRFGVVDSTKRCLRYNLKKKNGYIEDKENGIMYYTDTTKRSPQREKNGAKWWKFLPMP